MYRTMSDYALNKLDPDAIVYMDAWGNIERQVKALGITFLKRTI